MAEDTPAKTRKDPATRKFLTEAIARFKMCADAESDVRKESLDDIKFSIGEQWPADLKTERANEKRPCLTINRLPQFLRQVTNEQRQQRPAIQVNPIGNGADVEGAEIRQGIVRHIEVRSDAEVAYDTSYDQMVRGGFGYLRVLKEFRGDDTFEQELRIKRIKNQFKVYFDPACEEYDYSDARFCFIVEDVPTDAFKIDFPNATFSSLSDFESIGDSPGADWFTKETIRVAEYFWIENETKTLHIRADGSITENLGEGEKALRTRKAQKRVVRWCRMNALEIIEGFGDDGEPGRVEDGKYIPIVPVLGEDIDVNGKRYLAGLIRNSKDPQRAYNYWKSAATEKIALATKAPWLVAVGQLEGKKEYWRTANTKNWAYLEYNPVDAAGRAVPPPVRTDAEPAIGGMNEMLAGAVEDLQATTGIYNPSLGKTEGEQSGKAVLARQKQSDVSVLNFSDNFARSIRHTGRILLDLIPKVYDTPRIMRIIMPDETIKQVVTHAGADQADEAQAMLTEKIKKIYDLTAGEYDSAVSVGPSYQSKRQEAVESQMALIAAWPEGMQVIGDLLVRNMDWPQAAEIADRMKKMLPPQLQGGDDGDPQAMLQQAQAQLNALGQQHQAMVEQLQQATQIINTKQIEAQGKLQIAQFEQITKQRIEQMKIEAQITIAQIEAKSQDVLERRRETNDIWTELHSSAHETAMSGQEHNQALEQQAAAAAQTAAQQPNGSAGPTGGNTGQNPGA